MKNYILLLFAIITFSTGANAQAYNYAAYGVGFTLSRTRAFSDLKKNYDNKVYAGSFVYMYTPYLPITLEVQVGKLSGGGNTQAEDVSTRRYLNNFRSVMAIVDIQAGELMDYEGDFFGNIAKNFYAGIGFGAMINNVDANRESLIDPGYYFPGKNNSFNAMIPLRIGYELKFYTLYNEPNIRIHFGYQHNVTLGEGLDGYSDPSKKFKNNALDQYRQLYIGIRLMFGGESSYEKSIDGN